MQQAEEKWERVRDSVREKQIDQRKNRNRKEIKH